MAGERKGKTYEALVKVALDCLKAKGKIADDIFWNEKAAGMTVTPDFTVGPDVDHPRYVLLITHSGSAGDSHKKWWRNQGELAECKLRLATVPKVLSVAFDSVIKEELKKVGNVALDGQLIVGDRPYGPDLVKWIDSHHNSLPKDGSEKAEAIQDLIAKKDVKLTPLFIALLADLKALLGKTNPALDSLWKMERKRAGGKSPQARNTSVRRGLSKLLVFEDISLALRLYRGHKVPIAEVPQYAYDLKLAGKSIARASGIDPEISNAVGLLTDSQITSIIASFDVAKVSAWLTALRHSPHLAFMRDYVVAEYKKLCDPTELLRKLEGLYSDPNALVDLSKAPTNWPPQHVWLLEFLMEAIKENSGTANGYGYAQLARDIADPSGPCKSMPNSARKYLLSPWGHLSEWIHRVPKKALPPQVLECVARAISSRLGKVASIQKVADAVIQNVVGVTMDLKLCTYSGFDPLAELLQTALPGMTHTRVRSCYAESAGLSGVAGIIQLGQVSRTLVNWQSATDEGKDHKVKELCGRAAALRYSWDARTKTFTPRSGIKKLFLVVDGTWTQTDLDTLALAGWDEIFYPDEMTRLTAAIV